MKNKNNNNNNKIKSNLGADEGGSDVEGRLFMVGH